MPTVMPWASLSTMVARPEYAYQYEDFLPVLGFEEISQPYQPGDIVVFSRTGERKYGHIAIYTGNGWVSDFKQKSFYVHNDYIISKKYKVFRKKERRILLQQLVQTVLHNRMVEDKFMIDNILRNDGCRIFGTRHYINYYDTAIYPPPHSAAAGMTFRPLAGSAVSNVCKTFSVPQLFSFLGHSNAAGSVRIRFSSQKYGCRPSFRRGVSRDFNQNRHTLIGHCYPIAPDLRPDLPAISTSDGELSSLTASIFTPTSEATAYEEASEVKTTSSTDNLMPYILPIQDDNNIINCNSLNCRQT